MQSELTPTSSKASLYLKKVMLYIWWDWNGVLYYERLLENRIIINNFNMYCSQLGCPKWFSGKESVSNTDLTVSIPGLRRFTGIGNDNPFQYMYLEIP